MKKAIDVRHLTLPFFTELSAITKISTHYNQYIFPDCSDFRIYVHTIVKGENKQLMFELLKKYNHSLHEYEHIYFEKQQEAHERNYQITITIDYNNLPELKQQFDKVVTFNRLIDPSYQRSIDILYYED